METFDDIVIGAGHNGLTAAAYLARAGRKVLVLERSDHIGGATVSARPFPGMDARLSRYSYLVSLLPRQIITDLDLDVTLVRRRYSSYTPLPIDPGRAILVDTADDRATAASFRTATGSDRDFAAWQRFYAAMTTIAEGVFPTMLRPLISTDEMASVAGTDLESMDLWNELTSTPARQHHRGHLHRRHRARDRRDRRIDRHLRRSARSRHCCRTSACSIT